MAEKETPDGTETVNMDDGTAVEFVGKRNIVVTENFDGGRWNSTRFDFRDGHSYVFARPADDLLDEDGTPINEFLLAHGAKQKLSDAAAGKKSPTEMYDQVSGVGDRLNDGKWAKTREGNEFAGTSVLKEAIMRKWGRTAEQATAFLKEKSPDQKAAMRRDPRLKETIAQIEDERASKRAPVDTSALFDELDNAA